jgi:hypothetical protein
MSDSDSTPSTSSNSASANTSVNPAPYLKKKADNSHASTHNYFIPVVMVVVLAVIIIATFYSKEFNNLVASIIPSDQAAKLAPDATEKTVAQSKTIAESDDAEATGVTDAKIAATITTVSNSSASAQTAENALPVTRNPLASTQNQPEYPARRNAYAVPSPYAPPPPPYAMPGEWNAYNAMMQQRRQAYEEARRQQLQRMHEYQAAMMKRIEQDREDMIRHMQQLAEQSQKRRDEFISRMEQIEKASMDQPI